MLSARFTGSARRCSPRPAEPTASITTGLPPAVASSRSACVSWSGSTSRGQLKRCQVSTGDFTPRLAYHQPCPPCPAAWLAWASFASGALLRLLLRSVPAGTQARSRPLLVCASQLADAPHVLGYGVPRLYRFYSLRTSFLSLPARIFGTQSSTPPKKGLVST